MTLLLSLVLAVLPVASQGEADRLTFQEEKELKSLMEEILKAKPGTQAINMADPAIKRQFDLASRVGQLGLLKLNKAMLDKKYNFESDFVGFYMSRYTKLFEEKTKKTWLLAYAANNSTEKKFFDKELGKTGLKGEKKDTVIYSFYHLLYPAERLFYIEIVSIVYKNGVADFSLLPKRAKDWIAEHNDLFP